jgi:hypothetical protein
MSGMKRILKDGYLIFEKQLRFGSFYHTMPIDNHMISITEIEDRYDFRIDNQSFAILYLSEHIRNTPNLKLIPKNITSYERPKVQNRNVEFDTGFGKFDYQPTHESLRKSYAQKTEPEFITGLWEDKAPQETFNWNAPSNFQLDEPTNNQPAPLVHIQQPKEQPIVDFLDIYQSNNLPEDLFSDLNVTPPTTQQFVPLQTNTQPPTFITYPQLDQSSTLLFIQSPTEPYVDQPVPEEKKTPPGEFNAFSDTATGIKFL